MKRLMFLMVSCSIFLSINSMDIVEISVAHSSSSEDNDASKKDILAEVENQASQQSTPEAPLIVPKVEQERCLNIDSFVTALGLLGSHNSLDDYSTIYSAISLLSPQDFNEFIMKYHAVFKQFLPSNDKKHVPLKETEKQKLLIDVLLLMSKSYVSDHQSSETQLSKSENESKQYARMFAQYRKRFRISIGGACLIACWAIIATYFAVPK